MKQAVALCDIVVPHDTVRGGFLPIVSKEPGLIGYSVALTGQGQLITTSFFQDKAAAENSTRLAAGWVRDNLADAVEGPPKVTEGEVRVQERRRATSPLARCAA